MLKLSNKWSKILISQLETGMGYQVASIILKDGKRYDQAVIVGGVITKIHNMASIPFKEEDIKEILVTHEKWDAT
ncbi:MAG: hypothetical protein ACRDE2_12130 [Chitinophagaceae bacterium]